VIELDDWNEPAVDVEAMVRSAGRYIGVSEDLRPRVLEAARLQSGEHKARRRLRRLTLSIVLLALFTITARNELAIDPSQPNSLLIAAGFNELYAPSAAPAARNGDGDWRMIDAFTELRRQQAQLLRLAL
jgi:hypothetical protein